MDVEKSLCSIADKSAAAEPMPYFHRPWIQFLGYNH